MMVTTVKDLVPQTSRLVKTNPAQGNWPTVPNSQREATYEGWQAVPDQRLLRPDPDAGFAERLGVHRRQQLRPQRAGRAVPGQAETFTDRASWQGWSAQAGWGKPPTPLWPDRIGEMSVRQIDGKTVLSYFNASHRQHGGPGRRRPDRPWRRAGDDRRRRSRRGRIPPRICRRRRTTGSRSRTAATSHRARRSTSCGCSSASGTPARGDNAPYRVIQFAVNPLKP